MTTYLNALWHITSEMAPYLLLGFLVAGVLHVLVPRNFYSKYLSKDNFGSVLTAALLGIPLPLCSCGVIPTAIGLRNEKASKGAVASFLIATPQTGIDSIIATFSLMGIAFAVVRPIAALVTGICGGMLVTWLCAKDKFDTAEENNTATQKKQKNALLAILQYSFVDMIQSIGGRLFLGLLLAALIQIGISDDFFLTYGNAPLLQMLVMLVIAIPMYICSTGSIPIAAALLAKGLTPGAALVLLMAGPAVNLASIMVVKKAMGMKFTLIYVGSVVLGAILFGLTLNNFNGLLSFTQTTAEHCCEVHEEQTSWFTIICTIFLLLLILNVFIMGIFSRFKKQQVEASEVLYSVEGIDCKHCKAAAEAALEKVAGIEAIEINLEQKTVKIKGTASESDISAAIEKAGFTFKGKK